MLARGLCFNIQAAEHAIAFFGFLRHSKGEWAGQTFALTPWQAFVVGSLFGWQRADGLRRFRTAYCAVPRKNGKSTLSAGIALYLLVADGEQGAEVYSAATTREQARIVFKEAKRMVSSPALRRRVQVLINNLNVEASASRFMPLSSDASSMDGLNVHGAIIDELHAHKTRDVVDVLDTATGARRQPLLFEITTAGYDRHASASSTTTMRSSCWKARCRTTAGSPSSPRPTRATTEPIRRSGARRTRASAFGQGGRSRPQGREGHRATGCPERLPAHAPERMDRAGRALDRPAAWDACAGPVNLEHLRGRPCFGGLDLSTTTDITALAWVFPPEQDDGLWHVLALLRARGEPAKRAERDRVPYDLWTRQGFIEATPGNVVDYGAIEQRILAEVPCSRSRRSPTTPGTRPTSRCACRTRAPPWSSSARASAPWPPPPASSRS